MPMKPIMTAMEYARRTAQNLPLASAQLVLALAVFLWESRHVITQLDDAYISYRYAVNLVEGNGLVFNVGEYVEGYTNFLWTILVALGVKLGFDAVTVGYALGVASGAGLLVVTYTYALRFLPATDRWMAGFASLCLLAFNCFASWTSSGLETPLFALFVLLAFHAFDDRKMFTVSLYSICATMTRPEGVLLAALLLGFDFVQRFLAEQRFDLRVICKAALPGISFACYILLHTLFRLWYYGDILPNTFYAKVGGIPIRWALTYVINFFGDGPGLLLPGFLVSTILIKRFRIVAAYFALTVIYVIWVGGDVFALGRFFLPSLPFLVVGAMLGISVLLRSHPRVARMFAASVLFSIIWTLYGLWPGSFDFASLRQTPFPALTKRELARKHELFINTAELQKKIAEMEMFQPPVKLIAAVGMGELGYYGMSFTLVDLVGLLDPHIAKSPKTVKGDVLILPGHSRTDANYVISRKPDVIWIPKKGSPVLLIPAIADLWNHPSLEHDYYWDEKYSFYRRKPELYSSRPIAAPSNDKSGASSSG